MIILACQPKQTLTIGSDIKLTLVGVNGKEVRIGIAAPRDVKVRRGEIVARSMRESDSGQEDAQRRGQERQKAVKPKPARRYRPHVFAAHYTPFCCRSVLAQNGLFCFCKP
jgi:carbon storage regulator